MSVHVPSLIQVDVQMLDETVVRIDVGPGRSPELAVDVLGPGRNDDSAAIADVELEHRQKYELIGVAHLVFLSLAYVFIIPRQAGSVRLDGIHRANSAATSLKISPDARQASHLAGINSHRLIQTYHKSR